MLGWANAARYEVDFTKPVKAISYEIDMSNVCNLKCRTCNSYRSTKWGADEKALTGRHHGLLDSNWQMLDEDAGDARVLAFMGGEPLMHQDRIIDALLKVDRAGTIGQCTISFSTNCKLDFEPQLLQLLIKAESVSVSCSVDGYGQLNDYIRSESDWDRISDQILKFDTLSTMHDNFYYSLQPTYSVYNFNKLGDLIRWSETLSNRPKIDLIYLVRPEIMNAAILPLAARNRTIDEYTNLRVEFPRHTELLDNCVRFLRNEFDDALTVDDFKYYNDKLDLLRTTRLRDVNLELDRILRQFRHTAALTVDNQ